MAGKSEESCSDLGAAFAYRLRRWRTERRIPLKRMAADLGVSLSVISSWEHGTRFPSLKHLEAVSKYTGIPACQFLYRHITDCPHCRED
jgi:transcriptional regulator with XRE-family HTH domain